MSAINIFMKENEKLKIKYKNILMETDIMTQISKLGELLKENNTNPEIILKYLELKQDVKDENLHELVETYKDYIFFFIFNKKFGTIKTKSSFFQKIKELFEELKGIYKEKDEKKKNEKIMNIVKKENKKYKQTFPIFYEINKELYFNSLYYRFLKRIQRDYNMLIKKQKYNSFANFLKNLSNFIGRVFNYFLDLFENDDIFLIENYDDKQKNNITFS